LINFWLPIPLGALAYLSLQVELETLEGRRRIDERGNATELRRLARHSPPVSPAWAGPARSKRELLPDPAFSGVHLGVRGRPGLGQGARRLAGGVADRGADARGFEGAAEAVGEDLGRGLVAFDGQDAELVAAEAGGRAGRPPRAGGRAARAAA